MEFKLTLDEPLSFTVEPGHRRAAHANEFLLASRDTIHSDVRVDSGASLLMLDYTLERATWYTQTLGLSNFRHQPAHWRDVTRGQANLLTLVNPSVGSAINSPVSRLEWSSVLEWVLESHFLLAHDEAFALYFHIATDEIKRSNSAMFLIQWDNLGVLLKENGEINVVEYDRAHLDDPTKIIKRHRRRLASPAQIYGKLNYVVFIPCPPFGLLIQHAIGIQNMTAPFVSAGSVVNVTNSALVGTPSRMVGGEYRLTDPSAVRLAAFYTSSAVYGFERLRFVESGYYTDRLFSLGGKTTAAPTVAARTYGRATDTVTAEARDSAGTAAWASGEREARVKITLATSDTKYTPFVYGYMAEWTPVRQTRNTTPVVVPNSCVSSIEYSTDEWCRDEGAAQIRAETDDIKHIVERGDTTYKLEAREEGAAWQTLGVGIAKVGGYELKRDRSGRTWHAADLNLSGLWSLMQEKHILDTSAYDGLSIGEAVNQILQGSGLSTLASIPSTAQDAKCPAAPAGGQTTYSHAIKNGMTGWDAMRVLLMNLIRQSEEWRLRYDPAAVNWVLETKPRTASLAAFWEFHHGAAHRDASARQWYYSKFAAQPESPEANVIWLEGGTGAQAMVLAGEPQRLVQVLVNAASLNDPDSADYLGRVISLQFQAEELSTQADVDIWARRIYSMVAHRRLKCTLESPIATLAIAPADYAKIYAPDGSLLHSFWVKKRTIKAERGQASMTLFLDDVWEIDYKETL